MKESAVTVIGGGTMGREIAFVAARSGFSTYLVGVESRFLDNAREQLVKSPDRMVERHRVSQEAVDGVFENLEVITDRDTAVKNCSFDVEAIIEDLELNHQLLAELDNIAVPQTIL